MTKFKHLLALAALLLAAGAAQAERLKDIASIQGVRTNQLIGYGLVVGLSGSGDQTTQTPSPCRPSTTCWRSSASRCRPTSATCS